MSTANRRHLRRVTASLLPGICLALSACSPQVVGVPPSLDKPIVQ